MYNEETAVDEDTEIGIDEVTDLLDEGVENAEWITDTLLQIVKDQDLLAYFEPYDAVLVAKELWDGARSVAAGIVSADLAAAGLPIDLTFIGQEL